MTVQRFIRVDADGVVVQEGSVPANVFAEMQKTNPALIPVDFTANYGDRYIDGKHTRTTPEEREAKRKARVNQVLTEALQAKLNSPEERRRAKYPPVSDLVEAIYAREKGNPGRFQAWVAAMDRAYAGE